MLSGCSPFKLDFGLWSMMFPAFPCFPEYWGKQKALSAVQQDARLRTFRVRQTPPAGSQPETGQSLGPVPKIPTPGHIRHLRQRQVPTLEYPRQGLTPTITPLDRSGVRFHPHDYLPCANAVGVCCADAGCSMPVCMCVLGSRCPMLLQIIRVDACAMRSPKFGRGLKERIN